MLKQNLTLEIYSSPRGFREWNRLVILLTIKVHSASPKNDGKIKSAKNSEESDKRNSITINYYYRTGIF